MFRSAATSESSLVITLVGLKATIRLNEGPKNRGTIDPEVVWQGERAGYPSSIWV